MGGGRAPVDEPRLVLVVPQADPADVERVQGGIRAFWGFWGLWDLWGFWGFWGFWGCWGCVGAAEAQAVLHRVQLGQPPRLLGRRDLALDPGLEGPSGPAVAMRPGERALGPVPRLIEQPVKHIEIRLLLAYGRRAGGISLTKRHIIGILPLALTWRV